MHIEKCQGSHVAGECDEIQVVATTIVVESVVPLKIKSFICQFHEASK